MDGLDTVFDFFNPQDPFEKYKSEPRTVPVSSKDSSSQAEINKLRHDIERLLLISEALWTILRDQHGYNEETLQRRILEIDASDGKIDSRKATSPPRKCPKCGRVVAKHAARCMWCEALTPGDPFAR